jgi:hypothetical protein
VGVKKTPVAIPAVNFQNYLPPGHSVIDKKTEKEEMPFSDKKSGPEK